jgi:hypothetical protein
MSISLNVGTSTNINAQFQLVSRATFDTPLTCEQLKKRCHAAWWRTRRAQPVVGVNLDMEQAYFEPHNTAEAAKRWAAQTCVVATKTTVEEVAESRIRQKLTVPTMTLIVDPSRGARGCVLNVSHTLISLGLYDLTHEFICQLARPENERGIDAIFTPDFLLDITPRLPQSLSHAYSRLHQPTPEDLQAAMQIVQRAAARYSRSSIGIPLHPNWKNRPAKMQNKTIAFEPAEARAAFKCFKQMGITLTNAFFACMTSATAQTYSQGTEEGAHLLFSGNGRRFVDVAGDGNGPVTMAILPGGLWVNSSEADFRANDKESLGKLSKAIGHASGEDLASPHIISLYEQMAPDLVKAMANPQEPASTARLTLTSQGNFGVQPVESAGSDPMRMSNFNSGGRSTDPGVCFALISFRDELRFNLFFDERYFAHEDVLKLGHSVAGLFRTFIPEEEPTRAKL